MPALHPPRPGTKRAKIVQLMQRHRGATLEQIRKTTALAASLSCGARCPLHERPPCKLPMPFSASFR